MKHLFPGQRALNGQMLEYGTLSARRPTAFCKKCKQEKHLTGGIVLDNMAKADRTLPKFICASCAPAYWEEQEARISNFF